MTITATSPIFEFPANDADEGEGLGDAGIETFRDAPYASCAREAGQNSRDARLKSSQKPVRVTFDVLNISPEDFPSHDRLTDAFRSCLDQARDEKEITFFKNALNICSKTTIPVLRIADYSTTGLSGPPDISNTPFNSLLKSKGVSKKDSDTSGGSFGIGKNASMAVSELQTVFYSTRYACPHEFGTAFAAQGKAILVSHIGADGGSRRATGYWGYPEKFRAVTNELNVPSWLRRSEVGTSIFCMGFRESEHWAERMTCSLISNFFTAIHRSEMEFSVAKRSINRNTLGQLLDSAELLQAVETTAHKSDLEFAKHLYRCLTSGLAHEEEASISGLGRVRIRILAEKGMPSRVGFVRNGMLITDNLAHFGQSLARFPGAKDFICMVEPVDSEATRLLKHLENPAHNAFSAERLADPVKRQPAKAAMSKLGSKIREVIKAQAGIQHETSSAIEELAHLFGEDSKGRDGGNKESNPEQYTYKVIKQNTTSVPVSEEAEENEAGPFNNGAKRKNKTNSQARIHGRNGDGSGTGSKRTKPANKPKQHPIHLIGLRNRTSENEGRSIFFSVDTTGLVELSVQATGVNTPEPLKILRASLGEIRAGRVLLSVIPKQRYQLDVAFMEIYDGPIEVRAASLADGSGAE